MTKGEFTPMPTEEGADTPKKGLDLRRILLIVAVVIVVVIIIAAIIIGVMHVYFLRDESTGMTFEPNTHGAVIYEQGRPDSYSDYTGSIQQLLDGYENENQEGENVLDCGSYRVPHPLPPGKTCHFPIERLGPECTWQKDYGYDEGQPCVVLSLDRKKGWVPEVSNQTAMPADVYERYQTGFVPVDCKGVNEADQENLGPVQYYPPGFPVEFFPYLGQEGYMKPLVAVKFRRPRNGVAIGIECRIWVENLDARVSFELLVD